MISTNLFEIDRKFEQEFETAIQAISQEKKEELENEKLTKSRTWVICVALM